MLESIAHFTMNGGKITKNTSHKTEGSTDSNATCGGIYINGSYFTMNGGEISENEADSEGGIGGWNSKITINDGAITQNKATVGAGGGVYVNLDGWLIMNGGTISDNTSTNSGGGVCLVNSQTTMTMTGGTISNNSSGAGGGILCSGIFKMSGGTISDNVTRAYEGAGVSILKGGYFELNNGTISNNSTPQNGGGVHSAIGGEIVMNGGKVINNSAHMGAGICSFGNFTMTGGTISANTADVESGGVYNGYRFIMNDGIISGNSAQYGGGVYCRYNTDFTMTGGSITGNTATNLGGGIYLAGSTFQLNGSVQITENKLGTATNNVYLPTYKTINVTGLLSGAKIGITMQTSGAFTTGYSSYNSGIAPSMFFFADNGKEIVLSNNEAAIGTNAAPAPATKTLTWQYRVADGAWITAPESIVYTGSLYEVQAVYVDGSTTTVQTIAKKTYHDVNGNTVSTIRNAGTYAFLVNSTDYINPAFVLHITPVEITVEWDESKIYYSGSMQIPTHTLKGVLDSDKNYVKAVLDTTRAGINAGSGYSVSIAELSGTYAVNYKFAAGAKTTHNYSILKAQSVNPVVNFTGTLYSSSKLPTITLSAGDTAGTIEWITTSLKAGENVCEWRFTPASSDYTEQTGTYILYAEAIKPESIKATFNAGANTIYTTTTFEQLKSYIKLIAVNNDGSETEITDGSYTLYGELVEGTSSLSVAYSGLATTVEISNVQGGAKVTLSSVTAELTGTAKTDYTAFEKFNPAGVKVVATYSDGTTKQISDFTVAYADITKNYLCYGDTYVTIRYTDGDDTASYRLNGLTVVKAKPTVTPDISLSDRLIAGERLPKIALTTGDTDGNIVWKETTLTEGTKSYSWTFTPTDYFNYETVTGTYIFTAEKKALESIAVTYSPDDSFKVTTVTGLDEIRNYVTVEGTYNDGTTAPINNFELFGTLVAGKTTLTVTYNGASATFEVEDIEAVKESSRVTPKVTVSGLLIEGGALPNITLSAGDTAGTITWDDIDGDTAKLISGEHSYNWTFTPDDTDRYEVVTGSYTFSAEPVKVASIDIRMSVIGTPIYPETSLDDIKTLITVTATYNNGDTKVVDKADYELFATLKVGTSRIVVEYEGVTGSIDVTVQSSEGGGVRVAVKWMSSAYVYDGNEHIPTPYIEWNGEKILLEAELVDGYDGISAGVQKVTAVEPDSGKYMLTGETVMTYGITKAEISVVWSSEEGWTYNGEAQNPAAQIKATYNDGKIGVRFKITAKSGSELTDGKAVNAGTYIAEVELTGTDNYEVTGNTTYEFTILKKKVSKPSAMTNGFVYNGEEQRYIPVGYDAELMTITGDKQTEAGEHEVTVELKDLANYEWTDGSAQALSFEFRISAAPAVEPTGESGNNWWWIVLIVVAALAMVFAICALIVANKRKAVAANDEDGFYDDVTDEDLY